MVQPHGAVMKRPRVRVRTLEKSAKQAQKKARTSEVGAVRPFRQERITPTAARPPEQATGRSAAAVTRRAGIAQGPELRGRARMLGSESISGGRFPQLRLWAPIHRGRAHASEPGRQIQRGTPLARGGRQNSCWPRLPQRVVNWHGRSSLGGRYGPDPGDRLG